MVHRNGRAGIHKAAELDAEMVGVHTSTERRLDKARQVKRSRKYKWGGLLFACLIFTTTETGLTPDAKLTEGFILCTLAFCTGEVLEALGH